MVSRSVLFIVTSHDELGTTGSKTGVWLEELAVPYFLCQEAGFEAAIASTAGGCAPLDPASLDQPWLSETGQAFLDDPVAMARLQKTIPVGTVDPRATSLAALFMVGGTGAMWDFPTSRALGALISEVVAAGKPVAAICHGVAALLGATKTHGEPLVKGKRLTCFSNAEERMLEFENVVPFLVETALIEQGALYSCAPPFQPEVVCDWPLLTGQNPASAAPMAQILIESLTAPPRS